MKIDRYIESDSRWTLSTQQGPGINDVVPDWFAYQLGDEKELIIENEGKPYAGAMVKIECPGYVPPSNNFTLVFALHPITKARAQVYESDLRITMADGRTYLWDIQNNIALGGMLQVGTGSKWITTAVKLGVPEYKWNEYIYTCSFDETAGTSTISSVSVDGADPMEVNFTQPAQNLGWAPGVVFQNQRCLNSLGGYMIDDSHVSIEWV